jgi:hypothetical protein
MEESKGARERESGRKCSEEFRKLDRVKGRGRQYDNEDPLHCLHAQLSLRTKSSKAETVGMGVK